MVVSLQSLQWFWFSPGGVLEGEHIQNPYTKDAIKSGTLGSTMILHVTLLLLEECWLHMTPITHSSRPCLKTLMVLHTGFFTKTNKTSPVAAHQAHPSPGSRFCNTPSTTMGTSQAALVVQPSPWSRLGVSFPTKSLVVWAGERRHQAALSDI